MTVPMKKVRRIPVRAFALPLGVLALGCSTVVVHPSARDARWASEKWPGTTVAELEEGRSVFVARCAGCHNLPNPGSKSPEEWGNVVGEMATGARLTAADQDLVLRYLSVASERLRQGG